MNPRCPLFLKAPILMLALNLLLHAPIAKAQEFVPMTQEKDDFKITIVDTRWISQEEMKSRKVRAGMSAPPFFFAVDYRIEAPDTEKRNSRRPIAGACVEAILPNGWRMRGDSIGPPQDGLYTRVWGSDYAIDPRWGELKLEFTWQDPKTPPNANGRFQEMVEWKDIPLPQKPDETLALNLAQTTPNGTRLWLESAVIQGRQRDPEDKQLYLVGRWLPPENAPDLCAEIETSRGNPGERRLALEYDTGAPFQDRTHHINVAPGRSFGLVDTTAGYFTASAAAPPAEAKTATLLVDVKSKAPSLEQAQWTKRFDFTVPFSPVPTLADAPKTDVQPVAETDLGDSHLSLLPPHFQPERGSKNMWKAEVLLQSPAADASDRQWITTGVSWSFEPARNKSFTGMNTLSSPWRDDGTLLGPNEKMWCITPSLQNDQPLPAQPKLTIESNWKEVQRSRFDLDFAKLPVPQSGQILTPNVEFPVGEWGHFSIRKIGHFDAEHTLSPRVASRYSMLQPPYGLVVVLEYVPSPNAPKPVWGNNLHARSWDLGKPAARDSSGCSLLRFCDVPDTTNGPSADDLDPQAPVVSAT